MTPFKLVRIYALVDPREPNRIRYIGKTHFSLSRRLGGHITAARKAATKKARNHRLNWICALLAENIQPIILELCQVSENIWEMEERGWISRFKQAGHPLTNSTEGGDGCLGLSSDSRAAISSKKIGRTWASMGKVYTEQEKLNRSKAHKGRKLSPEQCARMSVARKGKPTRPMPEETKEKLRRPHNPEWNSRVAEALRQRWKDPVMREKMTTAIREGMARKAAETKPTVQPAPSPPAGPDPPGHP